MIFVWNTWSRLPWSLDLLIPVLAFWPYYFTHLTVTHTTHYLTPSNLPSRMRDYPYDNLLFHPTPPPHCRTCALPKPARSKHCSLCGRCVAKCDHHCPWINNCLGRGNYRYFLALLLSLGVLQLYGAYLAFFLLRPVYAAVRPERGSCWGDVGEAVMFVIERGGISIAGVGLLAASTAALPLGLLAYHCYLIWAGMTTNESQKWADWRDDMADGFAFKASRSQVLEHNRSRRRGEASNGHASGNGNPVLSVGESEEDEDVDWPVRSDQMVVRTNDGKPPAGQEALWTRVWSLDEVENVYDLGGWENFLEVLRGR